MSDDDTFYDVFLCYKWEDGEAAEALRVALVSRGFRVFRDVIEGEVWAPLAESIKKALARSRTLVALITPHFPVSPHCREELHVALCAAYCLDDGDTSRVMAVTQDVSPDDVRPRQLTRFRLPRHGTPPPELVADIARVVARCDGMFGEAPTRPEPTWYPHERPGDRFFRGRYGELWELHEGLLARAKNRDRGHPVVSVRGLGGVGKTALVLAYARLFERDHPGGVFVLQLGGSDGRSDTTDELVRTRYWEQLGLIAKRLNVASPDHVATELDRRGAEYLWIVDDVPTTTSGELMPTLYAPTRLGKTLITTRGRFARFASLEHELGELGLETGAQVLTAYRKPDRTERRSVLDIVRLLGQHPLGLTLAAGLTTVPSFTGYPALRAQLSSTEPDHLEVAAHLEHELPAGCARPFANALVRGFGSLTGPVKEVLCAASVLAPTVIPHDLLAGMAHQMRGINAGQVADGLHLAAERGLIDLTNEDPTMHPLVARSVRVMAEPAQRVRLRDVAVVELTAAVDRTRDAYRHREVLRHLPHVRAVVGLLGGGDSWQMGQDERYLLSETGRTQVEVGETRAALANYQALHAACESPGTVDAVTCHQVLAALAAAYGLEGHYSTALRLKAQAVDGLTQELGAAAPDTLTALNNLALSHLDVGDYSEAHALLCEVYRRRRDHSQVGPMHRDTLIALNNVAIARGHLGASLGERDHHRRVAHRYWLGSHARWQKIARPDDQYVLDVLNGLALSYRALGMLDEALEIIAELHDRRMALLGPDHPETLGTLENKLIIQEELRERTG